MYRVRLGREVFQLVLKDGVDGRKASADTKILVAFSEPAVSSVQIFE